MFSQPKPPKATVEVVRPSRIRRQPAPPDKPMSLAGKLGPRSREWEIRLAIVGVVLFALAFFVIIVEVSEITSH